MTVVMVDVVDIFDETGIVPVVCRSLGTISVSSSPSASPSSLLLASVRMTSRRAAPIRAKAGEQLNNFFQFHHKRTLSTFRKA